MSFAILLGAFTLSALAQSYTIAGTVVDGGSGSPMNRVRITLTPSDRPTDQRSVITGEGGKFAFDVPQGKFRIVAEYHGFRQPFGQNGPATGFGVAIFTGPDHDTSHLVFHWFAVGAISGRIVDDRGETVENALVQLIRVSISAGRKSRATVAWARTNDLGEYRFGQRAGGTYYLVVTAEPWYTARAQAIRFPGQSQEAPGEPAESYAPVYYPGGTDPSAAQPLVLAAGGEVRADFRLSLVPGVNLHVHCPHPQSQSFLISLLSDGPAGVDSYQRQVWLGSDDQIIAGVFPGRYSVTVEGRNGATSQARQIIDVGGADVSVDLTLAPPAKVSGKVTYKDVQRRPRRPAYLRLIDETTGAARAATIDGSGAFSIDNIPPGRRRVQVSNADGFFAVSVAAEGASLSGPVIEIASGAEVHLTVVAGDDVGIVKGFAMNAGQPMAGVLVGLAPKEESNDPGDYRGFQTDSDGSFDFQNVRAGDYILYAIDRVDIEYANAAAVRPYSASGTPLRVVAHQTTVENATLSTAHR